jgi:hypothetical protein
VDLEEDVEPPRVMASSCVYICVCIYIVIYTNMYMGKFEVDLEEDGEAHLE